MKLWNYDEEIYGNLGIHEQITVALINLSGRIWHGREWNEMNETWKRRQKCSKERLGNCIFYMNYGGKLE